MKYWHKIIYQWIAFIYELYDLDNAQFAPLFSVIHIIYKALSKDRTEAEDIGYWVAI